MAARAQLLDELFASALAAARAALLSGERDAPAGDLARCLRRAADLALLGPLGGRAAAAAVAADGGDAAAAAAACILAFATPEYIASPEHVVSQLRSGAASALHPHEAWVPAAAARALRLDGAALGGAGSAGLLYASALAGVLVCGGREDLVPPLLEGDFGRDPLREEFLERARRSAAWAADRATGAAS